MVLKERKHACNKHSKNSRELQFSLIGSTRRSLYKRYLLVGCYTNSSFSFLRTFLCHGEANEHSGTQYAPSKAFLLLDSFIWFTLVGSDSVPMYGGESIKVKRTGL